MWKDRPNKGSRLDCMSGYAGALLEHGVPPWDRLEGGSYLDLITGLLDCYAGDTALLLIQGWRPDGTGHQFVLEVSGGEIEQRTGARLIDSNTSRGFSDRHVTWHYLTQYAELGVQVIP